MKISRLVAVISLSLVLFGCDTKIQFENLVPGANVVNPRWDPADSDQWYQMIEVLRPGETSSELFVPERDDGDSGVVSFELEVQGSVVALVADEPFVAEVGETNTFTIAADTAVHNPLLDE